MTTLTFVFASAAPDGNGYQRVATDGPVESTCLVEGLYAKCTFSKEHLVFDATTKSGPIPLCPVGIGSLAIKNSYGFVNYNIKYMVLHYDGAVVHVMMEVHPEIANDRVNARVHLNRIGKR